MTDCPLWMNCEARKTQFQFDIWCARKDQAGSAVLNTAISISESVNFSIGIGLPNK
jgi:hypothetical protein